MSGDDWATSNERFDDQKSVVFQVVANEFLNSGNSFFSAFLAKEEIFVLTSHCMHMQGLLQY